MLANNETGVLQPVAEAGMLPSDFPAFEPDPEAGYDMSAKTLEIIKASKVTKFGFVHNELYYQFDKSPNAPAAK